MIRLIHEPSAKKSHNFHLVWLGRIRFRACNIDWSKSVKTTLQLPEVMNTQIDFSIMNFHEICASNDSVVEAIFIPESVEIAQSSGMC